MASSVPSACLVKVAAVAVGAFTLEGFQVAPPSVVSSGVGGESGHAPALERQARLPFNAARTRVGGMASGCAAVVAAGDDEGDREVDAAGAGVFCSVVFAGADFCDCDALCEATAQPTMMTSSTRKAASPRMAALRRVETPFHGALRFLSGRFRKRGPATVTRPSPSRHDGSRRRRSAPPGRAALRTGYTRPDLAVRVDHIVVLGQFSRLEAAVGGSDVHCFCPAPSHVFGWKLRDFMKVVIGGASNQSGELAQREGIAAGRGQQLHHGAAVLARHSQDQICLTNVRFDQLPCGVCRRVAAVSQGQGGSFVWHPVALHGDGARAEDGQVSPVGKPCT